MSGKDDDEKDWTDPRVNPLIPMPGRDVPDTPPELDPSKNELIVTPPGYERPAPAANPPVALTDIKADVLDLGDGWRMVRHPTSGAWWIYDPEGEAHALADPRPGDMDRIQRALRK